MIFLRRRNVNTRISNWTPRLRSRGKKMRESLLTIALAALLLLAPQANAEEIIHDAEYTILAAQNGEAWAADDKAIEERLTEI